MNVIGLIYQLSVRPREVSYWKTAKRDEQRYGCKALHLDRKIIGHALASLGITNPELAGEIT